MRFASLRRLLPALAAVALVGGAAAADIHSSSPTGTPPRQAVAALAAGNARFVAGTATHPDQSVDRRAEVAPAQHPIAVIVSCSDSRVPPEIVFDQGLGDLFVVRCAGNVVSNEDLGSIEYAAEHQGVRLVVVLGHQRCGAVTAAAQSDHAPGHIDSLVRAIRPAVLAVRGKPGDPIDNAVRANVRLVVHRIATSQPIIAPKYRSGDVQVEARD